LLRDIVCSINASEVGIVGEVFDFHIIIFVTAVDCFINDWLKGLQILPELKERVHDYERDRWD
jgi:hypothetical protein